MPLHLTRALCLVTLLSVPLGGTTLANPKDPEQQPTGSPLIDQKRVPSVLAPTSPDKTLSAPASSDDQRGVALAEAALQLVGYPYRWGGTSPARGFDCSGLAVFVFGKFGFDLPRTASEQGTSGRQVERHAIAAGDLLVFQNTYKAGPSHSGVYLGDGRFVHANDERTGVIVNSLTDRYWATRFYVARRLTA